VLSEHDVDIALSGGTALRGDLDVPDDAVGVVVFVHGTGSSRASLRNRAVAESPRGRGHGTLLFDLLTVEEEAEDLRTGQWRFDLELLATRLAGTVEWLDRRPELQRFALGLFGASTGAGAALLVAARRGDRIGAVVSRGGRPDLAGDALSHVRAPTLLIVGSRDETVLELNRQAAAQLGAEQHLEVVAGATHLFEEPGTLARAAELAGDWFAQHLGSPRSA
jgi:putative phosphoribosyl transferase